MIDESVIDSWISSTYRLDNLKVSRQFYFCAQAHLGEWWLKTTLLQKLPSKLFISPGFRSCKIGDDSSVDSSIWAGHYKQAIRIHLKSKSGKIWKTSDEVNCDDLEFWITGIRMEEFLHHLYGPTKLPFKLKNLSDVLQVGAIDQARQMKLFVHPGFEVTLIAKAVNDHIHLFNEQSMRKDRENGIVHNWDCITVGNQIQLDFDLGSAGFDFIKKLLKDLSAMNAFEKGVLGVVKDGA